MTYTIAISNRKGGTGKTTVSVNLAAELAAMGLRVLLIDLDSQGHCAVGVSVKVGRSEPTIHHLFRGQATGLEAILRPTAHPNLHLAPADPLFDHGSGIRVKEVLEAELGRDAIQTRFDVVVLDTPPSLDALLIAALSLANGVVIPYIPHHLSLEGVKQLMRVLFKVKTDCNPDLRILGFLPVMVAEHIKQHRAVIGEIAHLFGTARLFPGIRNDIKLVEAFRFGQPVRTFAPRSRGAEDFGQLGRAIAGQVGIHLTEGSRLEETWVEQGGAR